MKCKAFFGILFRRTMEAISLTKSLETYKKEILRAGLK